MSIHIDEHEGVEYICPSAEIAAKAAATYGDGGVEGVIASAKCLLPSCVQKVNGEEADGTWQWLDDRLSLDAMADLTHLALAWKKKGPMHKPSSWILGQSDAATNATNATTQPASTAAARSGSASRKSGTTTPKSTKSKARAK